MSCAALSRDKVQYQRGFLFNSWLLFEVRSGLDRDTRFGSRSAFLQPRQPSVRIRILVFLKSRLKSFGASFLAFGIADDATYLREKSNRKREGVSETSQNCNIYYVPNHMPHDCCSSSLIQDVPMFQCCCRLATSIVFPPFRRTSSTWRGRR